jgi:hypothetical protein
MALVVEEPRKVKIHHIKDGIPDVLHWFPKQEFIAIDKKMIPAISYANNPTEIINKDAVVFPKSIEDIKNPLKKKPFYADDEEKIAFIRGRKDESEQTQEFNFGADDDEEQSILIQKLREDVIRFEKLLTKYLDPDIPTGRKARKKFMEERDLFRVTGYKEFINTIDLKVDALCNFEDYDLDQFCVHKNGKCQVNWFKEKIAKALKDDFYSAQEIVNSVMQIVKEEEYAVPKRRIVTKLK